ncbi:Caffeoyl-CoA O-methyltransferase, partial [Cucurbita argyrosperma subsp. sororia]
MKLECVETPWAVGLNNQLQISRPQSFYPLDTSTLKSQSNEETGKAGPLIQCVVTSLHILLSNTALPQNGPALPVVAQMLQQGTYHGTFDFIFVNADKDNYLNYHKRVFDLVRIGGLIGYDNTVWAGSVAAPPDAPLKKYVMYFRDFVLEFHEVLAINPRIEIWQLAVGDGITLCRRIS